MALPGYEMALPNQEELLLHLRCAYNPHVARLCSLSTTNLAKEPNTKGFKVHSKSF